MKKQLFLTFLTSSLILFGTACSPTKSSKSGSSDSSNSSASSCESSCKVSSLVLLPLGMSDVEDDFQPQEVTAEKHIFPDLSTCIGLQEEASRSFTSVVSKESGRLTFTDDLLLSNSANHFYRPTFKKSSSSRLRPLSDELTVQDGNKVHVRITGEYDKIRKVYELSMDVTKFFPKDNCGN